MTYLLLTQLPLLRLVPLRRSVAHLLPHFRGATRRLRTVAVVLLLAVMAQPSAVYACTVCVGDPNDPQTKGASSAILLLMGVTTGVLGCFVTFFVYLWRRARRAVDPTTALAGRFEGTFRAEETRS